MSLKTRSVEQALLNLNYHNNIFEDIEQKKIFMQQYFGVQLKNIGFQVFWSFWIFIRISVEMRIGKDYYHFVLALCPKDGIMIIWLIFIIKV